VAANTITGLINGGDLAVEYPMKSDTAVLAIAVALIALCCGSANAEESCKTDRQGSLCYSVQARGLANFTMFKLVSTPDDAITVSKKFGVELSVKTYPLTACRMYASNPAAQKARFFRDTEAQKLVLLNESRIIDSKFADGKLQCEYEASEVLQTTGPYVIKGEVPKDLAKCLSTLVNRVNALDYRVKRQNTSTVFLEPKTADTPVENLSVTCAFSGPTLRARITVDACKSSDAPFGEVADVMGVPVEMRRRVIVTMQQAIRKKDGVIERHGFEISSYKGGYLPQCSQIVTMVADKTTLNAAAVATSPIKSIIDAFEAANGVKCKRKDSNAVCTVKGNITYFRNGWHNPEGIADARIVCDKELEFILNGKKINLIEASPVTDRGAPYLLCKAKQA
jgi:hypothetical protein